MSFAAAAVDVLRHGLHDVIEQRTLCPFDRAKQLPNASRLARSRFGLRPQPLAQPTFWLLHASQYQA